MNDPLKIYLPLAADTELELTCVVREYDGIDCDPGVELRQPTVAEMFAALDALRGRNILGRAQLEPTLDFPVRK